MRERRMPCCLPANEPTMERRVEALPSIASAVLKRKYAVRHLTCLLECRNPLLSTIAATNRLMDAESA